MLYNIRLSLYGNDSASLFKKIKKHPLHILPKRGYTFVFSRTHPIPFPKIIVKNNAHALCPYSPEQLAIIGQAGLLTLSLIHI